jgi:nicotinate-nucleotide--dimethylbenzimidazole phosphoribosyltransferase
VSYESQLNEVIAAVIPTQASAEDAAWTRLDSLTKPPRSLGRVEELAARVARVQGTDRPSVAKKAILLMAGDHGVVAEGVAAYPQDVTWQMVANIVGKGAAINQFAESVGAEVLVHDVGVIRDLSDVPGVVIRKVAPGTRNMAAGPAMTREEAAQAVMVGVQAARDSVASGVQLIGTGDMGIGNTTPASALTAAFADAAVAAVCGRGTGLDDDGVARKVSVVQRALAVNAVGDLDPLGVLAAVGGLEIAALAGVVIGAAEQRTCVIFDGFISGAAALAAVRMCPACADYLFASHRSMEPGHTVQFDALGQQPVLELDMRLGEGTGGALTMGVIDAACRMLSGMATFAEAGVDDKE